MEEVAYRSGNCSGNLSGVPLYSASDTALCGSRRCFPFLLSFFAEMVKGPGGLEWRKKTVGVSDSGSFSLFSFAAFIFWPALLSVSAGAEHLLKFSFLSGEGDVLSEGLLLPGGCVSAHGEGRMLSIHQQSGRKSVEHFPSDAAPPGYQLFHADGGGNVPFGI